MKLYIENLKDSPQNPLEPTKKFSNIAVYKMKVPKSVAFLYTNKEAAGRKTEKTNLFTVAPKVVKYIGSDFSKGTVYNSRTKLKETKNIWSNVQRKAMVQSH